MSEALLPLAAGNVLRIGNDVLAIDVTPAAGGRIARMACGGVEWLCGPEIDDAAIAWGCYPMLPWAGRIREGLFQFDGRDCRLPANLGEHAIHGVGFTMPWEVAALSSGQVELTLQLPRDGRWPFGGTARQRITIAGRTLRLELSLTAGDTAMPRPVLGWHPWFIKPEQLEFQPVCYYPRDASGIATGPRPGLPPAPWDDCFINSQPVVLKRAGQRLQLESDCDHWVVFDERAHATCVEPQTGPPDAFNLHPGQRLEAGASISAWFTLQWWPQPA